MKYYWLRHKDPFGAYTYECSNCKEISRERSTACPFCGKILNGTRNKTEGFDVIQFLKDSTE